MSGLTFFNWWIEKKRADRLDTSHRLLPVQHEIEDHLVPPTLRQTNCGEHHLNGLNLRWRWKDPKTEDTYLGGRQLTLLVSAYIRASACNYSQKVVGEGLDTATVSTMESAWSITRHAVVPMRLRHSGGGH